MNTISSYTLHNIKKGSELEEPVKQAFIDLGYIVLYHRITDPGPDVIAIKEEVWVVECLYWYGGYIHTKRFRSIVDNLCKYSSRKKFLICIGVKPTQEQIKLLKGYGIKLIYYKEKPQSNFILSLQQRLGVITLVSYSFYPRLKTVYFHNFDVTPLEPLDKPSVWNWLVYVYFSQLKNDSINHSPEVNLNG